MVQQIQHDREGFRAGVCGGLEPRRATPKSLPKNNLRLTPPVARTPELGYIA